MRHQAPFMPGHPRRLSVVRILFILVRRALRVLLVVAAAMVPGIPPPPPPPPQTMEQQQVNGQHSEKP